MASRNVGVLVAVREEGAVRAAKNIERLGASLHSSNKGASGLVRSFKRLALPTAIFGTAFTLLSNSFVKTSRAYGHVRQESAALRDAWFLLQVQLGLLIDELTAPLQQALADAALALRDLARGDEDLKGFAERAIEAIKPLKGELGAIAAAAAVVISIKVSRESLDDIAETISAKLASIGRRAAEGFAIALGVAFGKAATWTFAAARMVVGLGAAMAAATGINAAGAALARRIALVTGAAGLLGGTWGAAVGRLMAGLAIAVKAGGAAAAISVGGAVVLAIAAALALAFLWHGKFNEAVTRAWEEMKRAFNERDWKGVAKAFLFGIRDAAYELIPDWATNFAQRAYNSIKDAVESVVGFITTPRPGGFRPPGMHRGGNVTSGGSALVGERGPELLSLPRGAQVTPLRGQGGAQRVIIELAGDAGKLFRETLREDGRRGGRPNITFDGG